jgi:hypothetical protein
LLDNLLRPHSFGHLDIRDNKAKELPKISINDWPLETGFFPLSLFAEGKLRFFTDFFAWAILSMRNGRTYQQSPPLNN